MITPIADALFRRGLAREHGFEALAIEGTLPESLEGTLYRNGPAIFELFGRRYNHPFEGDGAITAIRFGGGRVQGACRITATAGLCEERAAGQMRHGWSAPPWRRVLNAARGRQKNTANTSVLLWQRRMFALMEGGRPVEIDPESLTTIGERDLGGVLGAMFSAHPHRVASRRAAYNFGTAYGRTSRLELYELPDAGPARRLGAVRLAAPVMLHDFAVSERHAIFFVSPVRIDVPRALTGLGTFHSIFRWEPRHGSEIIVVPLDAPADVVRFTVPAFHQFHFANAFEDGGEIHVDYCRYPDFASFGAVNSVDGIGAEALAQARLHRARLDLRARTITSASLADVPCDFPQVRAGDEGARHRHVWAADADLGGILCIDTERGAIDRHRVGAAEAVTEPVLAGPRGEWALTLGHDAASDRAFLAIFRSDRLSDGPVAKCWFAHHVPITFHGAWGASSS
ncbi:MAG TPA: carotenoid oxygenase family protein [Kofleriaceae bacterium]|nr:carotenoid oxygenase family protein [Kofleriaceae bacterium]